LHFPHFLFCRSRQANLPLNIGEVKKPRVLGRAVIKLGAGAL
jgi:hypothetical protein